MWTHASFCWEFIVLPGACVWSHNTYFNLSPIYHMYVFFVKIPYQARFCLQISYSSNFIYNANGIFKLWEFLSVMPFCRKQAKHSACQFSCRAHTITSFTGYTMVNLLYFLIPPQYVEKLEKILRFVIKEKTLTMEDLDNIWAAQVRHPPLFLLFLLLFLFFILPFLFFPPLLFLIFLHLFLFYFILLSFSSFSTPFSFSSFLFFLVIFLIFLFFFIFSFLPPLPLLPSFPPPFPFFLFLFSSPSFPHPFTPHSPKPPLFHFSASFIFIKFFSFSFSFSNKSK